MSKGDNFRDYLYVSVRKVVRMSQTLRTSGWQRLRGLDMKLGPLGGGVSLGDDPHANDVIAMVPRVEQAITKNFGVKALSDPDLQVGQWVQVTGEPMSYGVTSSDETVLFVGAGARLVLGGSAEYLLDRRAAEEKSPWRVPPSAATGVLDAMRRMQRLMSNDDLREPEPDDDAFLQHFFDEIKIPEGYNRRRGLAPNPEPLTSLARVLMIGRPDDRVRTVVGTPLYVAFHVPR